MGLTDDSRAAYRQIADDLRTAILDGRLGPGDQLPTTNELMAKYEVANMTVQSALRVLREQNLIYSQQGRGTFVRTDINAAHVDPPDGSGRYEAIVAQLDSMTEAMTEMDRRIAALEADRRAEQAP